MSLSSDCSFEVRRYGSKGPYVSHCDCEWVIDDKGPKSSRLPYNWGLEHLRGFGKSLPKIIGKISLMSGNVDLEDDSDSEAEAEDEYETARSIAAAFESIDSPGKDNLHYCTQLSLI